jgi:5-methylcytosine-specific restriction endonuclease McrA
MQLTSRSPVGRPRDVHPSAGALAQRRYVQRLKDGQQVRPGKVGRRPTPPTPRSGHDRWGRPFPMRGRKAPRVLRMSKNSRLRAVWEGDHIEAHDIYERDAWRCGICGRPVDGTRKFPHPGSPTIDHIEPLSLGGTHTRGNVQLAHFRCNVKKGNRSPAQLRLSGDW